MLSYAVWRQSRIVAVMAMGAGWWFLTSLNSLSLTQSLTPIFCVAAFWFMAPRLKQAADQQIDDENQTENALPLLEWVFSILTWLMIAFTVHEHSCIIILTQELASPQS